jgi:hypothetical protein
MVFKVPESGGAVKEEDSCSLKSFSFTVLPTIEEEILPAKS